MVEGDNGEQVQDEFHETSEAPVSITRVADRARDWSMYTVYVNMPHALM